MVLRSSGFTYCLTSHKPDSVLGQYASNQPPVPYSKAKIKSSTPFESSIITLWVRKFEIVFK
jgi:hypothetical protein